TFRFDTLPSNRGVPFVNVHATIEANDRFVPVEGPVSKTATEANKWFPATDPAIQELAARLTKGLTDERDKVLAFQRYLNNKKDIAYAGKTGSRYGVAKVIAQRFGHCWDKSDVLVTLCRSVGIPAREVQGWLMQGTGGHVWT